MPRLPAPALRSFAVLAVGAALALSHAAFASPVASFADAPAAQVIPTAVKADRQLTAAMPLEENCYLETQVERTPAGKVVTRRVQECD